MTDSSVARVSPVDQLAVAEHRAVDELGTGDRQRDPVGDVEAGVAAGLLDGADQVAGQRPRPPARASPSVSSTTKPPPGSIAGRGVPPSAAGDGLEGVLALDAARARRR